MPRRFGSHQGIDAWVAEIETLAEETSREREALGAGEPFELPRISYLCQTGGHVGCGAATERCQCACHVAVAV